MLRSSPALLRVTKNPRARKYKFDALDQPEDTAEPHEELYAYSLRKEPFVYHMKGSKGVSGYWSDGTYDYLEAQPVDEDMRDAERWRTWCRTQPIGPVRAGRLEVHLKEMGVLEPMSFIRTWCRWKNDSLAELTEAEGKKLLTEAATAIKVLKADPKRYDVPNRPPDKICEACGEEMWFIKTENCKHLPITKQGISHYLNCSNPRQFSRSSKKEMDATPSA